MAHIDCRLEEIRHHMSIHGQPDIMEIREKDEVILKEMYGGFYKRESPLKIMSTNILGIFYEDIPVTYGEVAKRHIRLIYN
jgi:hypothetical protein